MTMTVTVDDVLSWHPCWLDEAGGEARVRAAHGAEWTEGGA